MALPTPPRFIPDRRHEASGDWPAVELLVPADHLARKVARIIGRVDCGHLESAAPPRRRPPYPPRWLLAVWVYASLIGLHHASAVARLVETDAALRWLAGGHVPSAATLKRFRARQGELFVRANEQVLALAQELGVLDTTELAVDSLRLRADASTKAVRTLVRSEARLAALRKVDVANLTEEQRQKHMAKVDKHRAAVESCAAAGRTNVVLTAPSAGLLKFPSGASGPGHRITATAAGRSARFIVHVFVDAANVDYGHLEAAVIGTRDVLSRIGARPDVLKISADPGYHSEADLAFADANRPWADILIREHTAAHAEKAPPTHYERSAFTFHEDGSVVCPAGRPMVGPRTRASGEQWWRGDGCSTCPLRAQCTPGTGNRVVTSRPAYEKARDQMRARMGQADAAHRYGGRMAIVEPVFSSLADAMRFVRSSSRNPATVTAEVLLKVLAHNIKRLWRGQPLRAVWTVIELAPNEPD